jgi:hypothetical protein
VLSGHSIPIRVVLVDLPRMLSDLVETSLRGDPGIQMVPVRGTATLAQAACSARADVILCGRRPQLDSGDVAEALDREPQLSILGIESGARRLVLYELGKLPLGEAHPDAIVAAVRLAAGRRRTMLTSNGLLS